MRASTLIASAAGSQSVAVAAQATSCGGCSLAVSPLSVVFPATTTHTVSIATVTTIVNAAGASLVQTRINNNVSASFMNFMSSLYQGSPFTVITDSDDESLVSQTIAKGVTGLQLQTVASTTSGALATCVAGTVDLPTSDQTFDEGSMSGDSLAVNQGVNASDFVAGLVHAYLPEQEMPSDCHLAMAGPSLFQVRAAFVTVSSVIRADNATTTPAPGLIVAPAANGTTTTNTTTTTTTTAMETDTSTEEPTDTNVTPPTTTSSLTTTATTGVTITTPTTITVTSPTETDTSPTETDTSTTSTSTSTFTSIATTTNTTTTTVPATAIPITVSTSLVTSTNTAVQTLTSFVQLSEVSGTPSTSSTSSTSTAALPVTVTSTFSGLPPSDGGAGTLRSQILQSRWMCFAMFLAGWL